MGNCKVNKFNGVYNDDTLPLFGKIVIHATKKASVAHNSEVRLSLIGDGQTVSVTGNGYFATTYAGLDNPSSRLTTLTLSGTSVQSLFFKNDDYDVHITGKYGGISRLSAGPDSISYTSIFRFDTSEIKWDDSLVIFSAGRGITGKAEDIVRQDLTNISINDSQIDASLMDFADCTSIAELRLPDASVRDDVMDFVERQVELGRTEYYAVNVFNLRNFGKIKGTDITYDGNGQAYIEWHTASKVTVYLGNANPVNAPKIYAYGATAEEIAAWEAAGKTVVVVN